ncbi:type IV secretory system conjugative DNA transfer family protein [Streptomyces sp. NPDC002078]
MVDRQRLTFELTFPTGVTLPSAGRIFTGLSGLFSRTHRGPLLLSQSVMTYELLSVSNGFHHLLTLPAEFADSVLRHLRGAMPGLKLTEVAHQARTWMVGQEMRLADSEEPAADASYIPVALHSLSGLDEQEAANVQIMVVAQPDGTFLTRARAATTAATPAAARALMRRLRAAYNSVHVATFSPMPARVMNQVSTRTTPVFSWPNRVSPDTLSIALLAPIGSPQVAGMRYNRGRTYAPDPTIARDGLVVARANYQGAERPLAMTTVGRASHTLVVGPNGSGKSTLLEKMMEADIAGGGGFAYIDPKGDSAERVADLVTRERIGDVIYFDVTDLDNPIGFNLLAGDRPDRIAGQLVLALDKLFNLSSTPRAIDVLRSTLMSLAEVGHTIIDVPLILEPGPRGQPYRDRVAAQLTNRELISFWVWYGNLATREQAEVAAPIIRRLRPLSLYPELRATFGQATSGFNLRDAIRQGKIILVPLQSAQLHEEAKLVGTLFLNGLWNEIRTAGLTRNFPLYVDEFREVANLPIPYGQLFEQARGYKMPIIAATQDIGRFKDQERKDLTNNTRNKFTFQPAVTDARLLAAEMGSEVTEDDLMSLGPRELMMRFMVDGVASLPATGRAYPPSTPVGLAKDARASSRVMYGRPRAEVEAEIERRHSGSRTAPRAVMPRPDEPSSPRPAPMPLVEETGWEPWDGSIEA